LNVSTFIYNSITKIGQGCDGQQTLEWKCIADLTQHGWIGIRDSGGIPSIVYPPFIFRNNFWVRSLKPSDVYRFDTLKVIHIVQLCSTRRIGALLKPL
jgi:hypothetical protein